MLSGIRVYSADGVWRSILRDLGATVLDAPTNMDVNLDSLDVPMPISLLDLKTALINAADNSNTIRKVFGKNVCLSNLHSRIVVQLYKSGGMNATELKNALGYSPYAATHTVDTAIYQLRKMYGHDFIVNENGVYRIGKL